MKKKTKRKIEATLDMCTLVLILIISSINIFLGSTTYANGYHNIDRGFNLIVLNNIGDKYGVSFTESGSDHFTGERVDSIQGSELISSGYTMQQQGVVRLSIGWFGMGICVMAIGSIMYKRIERL